MGIAVGGILRETSTFLPFRTTLADFERGFGLFRGSALRKRFAGTYACMGAFFDAADGQGYEAVPLLWGFAYPSGLIHRRPLSQWLQAIHRIDSSGRRSGASQPPL